MSGGSGNASTGRPGTFEYDSDGRLSVDGVVLDDIAEEVGTPVYIYSTAAVLDEYGAYASAFEGRDVRICYAMKANDNLALVAMLAAAGAGADVVSGGELATALAAGVPADRIVFSGVGKTRAEIASALDHGIMQLNVESVAEIDTIAEIAAAKGIRAPIAIRVNPDVDAKTLDQISTGRKTDKFGIAFDAAPALYAHAAGLPSLSVEGIAVHIGSQLMDLEPYRLAFAKVASMVRSLEASGIRLSRIDLGGGIGVAYGSETPPGITDYAAIVDETLGSLGRTLVLEPGRRIVARAGVLLAGVIATKEAGGRRFLIVDAAMNDLMRPALYGASHPVRPVRRNGRETATMAWDIVGPVCESTDVLGRDRALPALVAGDRIAIEAAGAYGAVMASEYNGRPRAAEVVVDRGRWATVRPRPSYDDMLKAQRLPEWLAG